MTVKQYSQLQIRKCRFLIARLMSCSILSHQGLHCNVIRRRIFSRACTWSRFNVVLRLLDFDLTFYRIFNPNLVELVLANDEFALAHVLLEKGFEMNTSSKPGRLYFDLFSSQP